MLPSVPFELRESGAPASEETKGCPQCGRKEAVPVTVTRENFRKEKFLVGVPLFLIVKILYKRPTLFPSV